MSEAFAQKPKEGEPWDVVIIGSGPSSLTAAIYTTRGALSTLILAGERWGGQLMLTTVVDNFPGFDEGIQGPELMSKMLKQSQRFGAEVVFQYASSVNFNSQPFEVNTLDTSYKAKSVILATGAETNWLKVKGEEKLIGRGVSSCAPCDAPFFKNKKVIVVGGGDSAMEEALILTKYAKEVTIIHRREQFRASAAMQKRVFDTSNIKVIWNTEVIEVMGENKLEKVILKDNKNQVTELLTDGLFVAIGHTPSTNLFQGKIDLDEKGYIRKRANDKFQTSTNVEGIFVAGDVHDIHYKQAITAAGFGCMAAMDAIKYLELR